MSNCRYCQKALHEKRSHAAYCSARCRAYANRKRNTPRALSPESVTMPLPKSVTPAGERARVTESVTTSPCPESVTPALSETVTAENVPASDHATYWTDARGHMDSDNRPMTTAMPIPAPASPPRPPLPSCRFCHRSFTATRPGGQFYCCNR